MEKDRVYTLSQVAHHNSKEDCWFTINGRVIEVTKFLEEHPGGEEVLIEYAGKDATKGFEAIGHSKGAHNLLSKYQVGLLHGYSFKQLDLDLDHEYSHKQLHKDKEMEAYVIKDDDQKPKNSFLVEYAPLLVVGLYLSYRCINIALQFGS